MNREHNAGLHDVKIFVERHCIGSLPGDTAAVYESTVTKKTKEEEDSMRADAQRKAYERLQASHFKKLPHFCASVKKDVSKRENRLHLGLTNAFTAHPQEARRAQQCERDRIARGNKEGPVRRKEELAKFLEHLRTMQAQERERNLRRGRPSDPGSDSTRNSTDGRYKYVLRNVSLLDAVFSLGAFCTFFTNFFFQILLRKKKNRVIREGAGMFSMGGAEGAAMLSLVDKEGRPGPIGANL